MIRATFLFLTLLPFAAMAASPGPRDFAWKSTLSFPLGGALYELSAPLALYRGIGSPELADICILNGRNEIVPFSVTTPPSAPVQKRLQLPLFPIPGKPAQDEKLSIRVERRSSGEIVTVSNERADALTAAYLVDASAVKAPLESLELEWRDIPEGGMARVSLEASDDLEFWRPVTTVTIAAFKRGGSVVEQKQIPLSGIRARYLRIVQKDSRTRVAFTNVMAVLSAGLAESPRERLAVAVSSVPGQPGEYLFDISGRMPVDRIRVLLPERNSLTKGVLFSRTRENDPWIQRREAIIYRIDTKEGGLVSPDLAVPASGDRYWKLKISEVGGGAGSSVIQVEVAWVPHKILFLPRGEAPFVLAFGSGRADTRSIRGTDLLAGLPVTETAKVGIMQAEAGKAVTLAGETAMKKEISGVTRKKLLLWGVLLVGVGVLAWMALRLARQMKHEDR